MGEWRCWPNASHVSYGQKAQHTTMSASRKAPSHLC
jgi:hypothetical protein